MTRLIAFIALAGVFAAFSVVGCSSDEDTPLGAAFVPDSLILSEPGEVFLDTLLVTSGDGSFVVNAWLGVSLEMEVGRRDSIERTAVVRFDFANPGDDTLLVVERAEIALQALVADGVELQVQFFELTEPFNDGDTLTTLDLAVDPLPDPETGSDDRLLVKNPDPDYRLDPALVQEWIRGTKTHNGIAFVESEGATDKIFNFVTKEGDASETTPPILLVVFVGGGSTNYQIAADGTFIEDGNTTANLPVADGEVRRIQIPVDLSGFDTKTLLHDAQLTLRIDTLGTVGQEDLFVTLYRPSGSDPTSLLTGADIATIFASGTVVTFPVRAEVEIFLADSLLNHGFVLKYTLEGATPRRLEFFGSNAPDSLKPSYRLIFSEPAKFPKP